MWWNYRKPKPKKKGGFTFAAKNNVPVLPCFITMKDSDIIGEDGFFVQEYTIHILPAIYPDASLPSAKAKEALKNANYEAWVKVYEDFYKNPLVYSES